MSDFKREAANWIYRGSCFILNVSSNLRNFNIRPEKACLPTGLLVCEGNWLGVKQDIRQGPPEGAPVDVGGPGGVRREAVGVLGRLRAEGAGS